MPRKRSYPTLAEAMASMQKQPAVGVSQGRGNRKDHGAREAAIGTPNRRFDGNISGDENAQEAGTGSGNGGVSGGSPGSASADGFR